MNKKHRGARSELIATCWLLAEGYEVFRNVSPFGVVDVIATKDDQTLLLDIKTSGRAFDVPSVGLISHEHRERGVKLLLVDRETDECRIYDLPAEKQPRKCRECEKEFIPRRTDQILCTESCARRIEHRRYVARKQGKIHAAR